MLSNPNHHSTDKEDEFISGIKEGTVVDVDYDDVIPNDNSNG